jgi:hypothetical protein
VDLHDLWQENKRWILGVAIGLLVFWVGTMVIDSMWSPTKAARDNQADVRRIGEGQLDGGFYAKAAYDAAKQEGAALAQQLAHTEAALRFVPAPEYELDGKGEAHAYFDRQVRAVRSRLLQTADELGIEVSEKALAWTTPVGPDETRAALIGLNLLDVAVTRLFAAHRELTSARSGASGVVAIESFKIETAKTPAGGARPGRRTAVEDPVEEHKVGFTFRADALTIYRVLELFRSEKPPIALAPELKIEPGRNPRDPMRMTGRLLALTLRT